MSDLDIEKTFNTPAVSLNYFEGIFRMIGRAIPEDPVEFFEKIMDSLKDYYYNEPQPLTKLEFQLEYVNSGSSKMLIDLFSIVKARYEKGYQCKVLWFYDKEDESIQELGQYYKNNFKIPFELIEF